MKPKPFVFFVSSLGIPIPDSVFECLEPRVSEVPEYSHAAFLGQMVQVSASTPRRRRFWSRRPDSQLLRLNLSARP